MKIILPNFLKKINILKFLPFILTTLALITVLYFSNFLYKNYFQMKKVINKISKLTEEVTPVIVDIKTYNLILENLEKKQQKNQIDFSELGNPFKNTISENN